MTDPNTVPVHLASSDVPMGGGKKRARVSMLARTINLTSNDPVQQIMPQSDSRTWAWMIGNSSAVSASAGGTAVVPAGAGTVIASWTVPLAGAYTVTVAMTIAGPVAADRNNMDLYVNGALVTALPVGTNTAPQTSVPVVLQLAAGSVVTVQQIAVTTATGYLAILTATPATDAVFIGTGKGDVQTAAGVSGGNGVGQIPSGLKWDIPTTDQVWAGAPANILPVVVTITSFYEQPE